MVPAESSVMNQLRPPAATVQSPGGMYNLLPVEVVLYILRLFGLPERQRLRGLNRTTNAAGELALPKDLIISLQTPPSWMRNGHFVRITEAGYAAQAAERRARVSQRRVQQVRPLAGVYTRRSWMRPIDIDLLQLNEVEKLAEPRFSRLGELLALRSLWIYAPIDVWRRNSELDLARLASFADSRSLVELRLDVPVVNPTGVRLPSVRRLQLSVGFSNYSKLDIGHSFPQLKRLACDVIRLTAVELLGLLLPGQRAPPLLEAPAIPSFTEPHIALVELRLFETFYPFTAIVVQIVRRWLPALRRLRLEVNGAEKLELLAGFKGFSTLKHIEFTSVCLVLPFRDTVPKLANLRLAVASLQEAFNLEETVVSLWGFRLRAGNGQADLLHGHLNALLEAANGEVLHTASAFDKIPLDSEPDEHLTAEPSAL